MNFTPLHVYSGYSFQKSGLKIDTFLDECKNRGFNIVAFFDKDPEKIGTEIAGKPVYPMEDLPEFINRNEIEIVALTIPKEGARKVAEMIKETYVKGILNFAHTDLNVPKRITVENVHISDYIMRLCYTMHS